MAVSHFSLIEYTIRLSRVKLDIIFLIFLTSPPHTMLLRVHNPACVPELRFLAANVKSRQEKIVVVIKEVNILGKKLNLPIQQ